MKKNKDLNKEIQNAIKREPLQNAAGTCANSKFSNHVKKLVYITSLAAIGLLFNGCYVGYVATEPAYVEYSRPPQPTNVHFWINGDWVWNYQTHVYVQKTGYWEKPRQGQIYVAGHWNTTPRGRTWANGHWQKHNI